MRHDSVITYRELCVFGMKVCVIIEYDRGIQGGR